MDLRRAAAAITLLVSIACGGGDSSPTPTVPVVATGLPTGSILTFRLGDTGEAVADAEVVIDGQAYRTSPSGDIQLQREARFGAPVHATSPAMLDRVTLLHRDQRVQYLWPREPEPGLSEGYTANLVYTRGDAAVGTDSLWRLQAGTTSVAVNLSPELASDPDAFASHDEAAAIMTAATGGQVRYFVTTERPATGVIYDALIDGNAGNCPREAIRGFVSFKRGARSHWGVDQLLLSRSGPLGHGPPRDGPHVRPLPLHGK